MYVYNNDVYITVTRKRVADSTVSQQAVKRQKKTITPDVNKPVLKENTIEQQNVSKTNTSKPQNEIKINTDENKMVWIKDIKNRKSPRKVWSNDLKLPPKEELPETKSTSKDDSSLPSPSKLSTHTLRKRLTRGKKDTTLETPLQSIPEISGFKSPQNCKSPNPQVERLTRGKQEIALEKLLQSIPEISGLKSPQTLKSPKSQIERLTRSKQEMALENTVQSISEISNLKSHQKLKSPKPQVAYNKSGTPKSLAIKSSKTASNEVPRLQTLRSRSSKPPGISPAQKTEDNISQENNSTPIKSRQNSISSISNLSWTRDISSSSTTTCVTVSSSDFVCIDKKIPLIKLANVDSEIHKYKSKNIATVDDANEVDEDSSSTSNDDDYSSSDSERSADSNSRITTSVCTSVKVNSLNLSSPSRNSIVENKIEEHDPNKKDFGNAAEKLMQALNKIDMEFINWIHDSDFATSDLNKIKANLFNILNNEFCALRHCRYLQDISNPEKTEDPYIDITNKPEIVRNNPEKKKLEAITIESNSTEMHKTERNRDESETIVSKLVNNNISESNVVEVNDIDRDAVATKVFKINEPCEIRTFCNKDSPPRNDINVTSDKRRVETDRITRNLNSESFREEAFTKPSTSGCAVTSKVRRISEFNDSDSEIEDFTADAYANKLSQSAHDDDDALSLFAESITGIESSKINASIMSTAAEKQLEEYVPKPKQKVSVSPSKQTYSYLPTKISDHCRNGIVKTVCEKQNADSTSVYKETNDLVSGYKETDSFTGSAESHPKKVIPKSSSSELNTSHNVNRPCLLANLYTLKPKEHNVIFEGYCFFNLIHRCSSSKYGKQCRKSHDKPDEREISNKLGGMSNKLLIKEYMLIRRDIHIMRSYGLCFLFECVRRKLTRVVVEIAYDFIMKGIKGLQIDEIIKIASVEVALLHLNEIDLSVCEDILKLRVGDSLLCEIFMQVMTSTQNFARFKSVFLSLTYFMVNNDRTFSLEVAEQILERVCILPFDETVVRALIQIMRLTKPEIFLNSMIENFEKLIRERKDIFDEYILAKSEINIEKLVRQVTKQRPGLADQPVLPSLIDQPRLLQSVPQSLNIPPVDQTLNVWPEMREGVPLPPSPDTTHLDNMVSFNTTLLFHHT